MHSEQAKVHNMMNPTIAPKHIGGYASHTAANKHMGGRRRSRTKTRTRMGGRRRTRTKTRMGGIRKGTRKK